MLCHAMEKAGNGKMWGPWVYTVTAPVMYYVNILMVGNHRQAYASLSVGRYHESVLGQTYNDQWNEKRFGLKSSQSMDCIVSANCILEA